MNLRPLIRSTLLAATVLTAACTSSSAPDTEDVSGGCVTDFSCSPDQECRDGSCAPIGPSLYPHIQTASCVLRAAIDDEEVRWRASHYDLLISHLSVDEERAVNPNIRLFEYALLRYIRPDAESRMAAWASARGYDAEDFFLHYREDTAVPTWEGHTVVAGFPAGIAPGWNPGGGGNPASATERSQSRAVSFYSGFVPPWYLANAANAGYRNFVAYYMGGLIDGTWWNPAPFATGPIDGVMCDDAIYYSLFGEGAVDHTSEYYGIPVTDDNPYPIAIEQAYPHLAQDLMARFGRTKDVMPNYGHVFFLNYPNRSAENVQKTTPWIWGEVWVTYTGAAFPTSGNDRCITYDKDYENGVRAIVHQTRAGGRRVLGSRDTSSGTAGTDRGKLFTLGLYYLVHDRHTYYMYETSAGHSLPGHVSTWAWNPAITYDVGQPDVIPNGSLDFDGHANTKEHYVFASGPDPYDANLTYRVLARRFTNALVLVKMMPEGSTTDDRSITTHPLDGPYYLLQADGSLGPLVTEATLRNNEALILIKP